ncbi:serine/threonine-protein kinase [Nocardia jejuensis]|uniref:serine/threonine-protein kinase n=1 Tax=Nocardia jejuensis TaxID=328049 RepID=UPI001FE202B3|nr:serine/threonine-protein kinase [Nocardia jejuensis]
MRAGEIVAGYLIERRLGGGGMGEVFLARHPRLPRRIALKVLSQEFATDSEIRARFEREAELIARLDHPNIVSVYDRGVDGGRLWIAMQFVNGLDVAALDAAELTPARAIRIIVETARALDYAHSVGIIHRDVKPANIMLARSEPGRGERVLLADFGIGRLRDDAANLTRTGTLIATLAYASPEQLAGAVLDARSDQYSLACTFYRLLCGATPFEADSAAAVVAGHLHYPPPPVSSRNRAVPAALDVVLSRALSKRAVDRFDSCGDFAAAAAHALSQDVWATEGSREAAPAHVTVTAPSAPTASAAIGGSAVGAPVTLLRVRPEVLDPAPEKGSSRFRRTPWVAGGAATLVAVLAVSAGIVWSTRDSESSSAPPQRHCGTGCESEHAGRSGSRLSTADSGRRAGRTGSSAGDPVGSGRGRQGGVRAAGDRDGGRADRSQRGDRRQCDRWCATGGGAVQPEEPGLPRRGA